MVAKVVKSASDLVVKYDVNLALSPRSRPLNHLYNEGYRLSLTPRVPLFPRWRSKAEEREERVPASQKNKWCSLADVNHPGKAGHIEDLIIYSHWLGARYPSDLYQLPAKEIVKQKLEDTCCFELITRKSENYTSLQEKNSEFKKLSEVMKIEVVGRAASILFNGHCHPKYEEMALHP
ncbi:hypothetical protein TNCV_1965811 [Trichonephila clavipes]|nr:hypothetical protein TNCV_1965811 [Trichonephila clavipes]